MLCLDKAFSTTRQITKERPVIESQPENKFETMLFLPEGEGRQGEGGLRTQGYFKTSAEDKPLITVITVVFNGEQFLEETILSVINQTYDNVEYIIIDGGSTDGTLDIIRKYEHAIDYWVSEKDKGIYDAFNKAVCLAQGKYYIVVGSDDILFKESIDQVVSECLSDKQPEFIVAGLFLGNKLRTGMRPEKGWLGAHEMVNGHSVGMIIRKSTHHYLGLYNTDYKISADALFIKKLFLFEMGGVQSDVIMGRFSIDGISNANIARCLCEGFLVQIETERFKVLQVFLFIVRILKNIHKICKGNENSR